MAAKRKAARSKSRPARRAKKKRTSAAPVAGPRRAARAGTAVGVEAPAPAGPKTIQARAGDVVTVSVAVDPPVRTPYHVAFAGATLLRDVRSGTAGTTPLTSGVHVLSWTINHVTQSAWTHALSVTVGGDAPQVLDASSSAQNGDPVAVDDAIFVVS